MKIIKADFGTFTFLDEQTVAATANHGVEIDRTKAQYAIDLIEKEMPADYGIILDRKADYSVAPIEVYQFFASQERLKAIAIVTYNRRDFLPDNLEEKLFGSSIQKFASIMEAHNWIKYIIA